MTYVDGWKSCVNNWLLRVSSAYLKELPELEFSQSFTARGKDITDLRDQMTAFTLRVTILTNKICLEKSCPSQELVMKTSLWYWWLRSHAVLQEWNDLRWNIINFTGPSHAFHSLSPRILPSQGLVVKPGGPIMRGGQFHLSCSVAGAVDPKFIWYKDGRYLINATMASRFMKPYVRAVDSDTVGVLVVQEAGEWDNGKFFCRVRNRYKIIYRVTKLTLTRIWKNELNGRHGAGRPFLPFRVKVHFVTR